MNPTHKAYTFASRTSPVTNQSLQKSMLFPTLIKNKKSPPFKKNKTLPTHNPPDKNGMIELIDYYNGMSLDKKEGQLVTGGIFYCRESANLKGCSSLQTSSWLDSDVHRNRQQKHTANPLGDIFLKNLFIKCFWWALKNKEFDFFKFLRGMIMCFLHSVPKTFYFKIEKNNKTYIMITTFNL